MSEGQKTISLTNVDSNFEKKTFKIWLVKILTQKDLKKKYLKGLKDWSESVFDFHVALYNGRFF